MIWPFAPPAVSFEPAQSERAGALARLHATGFAHPWGAEEFERLLVDRAVLADVAVIGPQRALIGAVLSRMAADEAEILTIAIDPGHRRRGVARQLLNEHMGQLARRGIAALFLEVGEDNAAARALYARLGFREVGRRASYYRAANGARIDALVLRRDLG